MSKKKSVYMIYATDGGCAFHRVLQPSRFCNEYFEQFGWEFFVGPGAPPGHDVYLFNGLLAEGRTLMEVARIKRRGAKFVWGLDDDWTSIPDWNPAKPSEDGLAIHMALKEMSDYILVSTPYLGSTLADVSHKVLVAPNLIDTGHYPPVPSVEFEDKGGVGRAYQIAPRLPVRIVWVGSDTHQGDTDVVTDCLDRFLSNYSADRAVVIFQGMAPNGKLVRKYLHRNLYHQPPVPFPAYQKVLNSIEPHIYLCPLATIPFNESKSNLRIMEAWALAAAPVATEWGEYKCIRNGIDGRLVGDPEAWYSALTRLVNDHETRISMAVHGRVRVETEYNWQSEQCRKPWITAFSKILGVE